MNGLLLVDKPGGMTSHDVVAKVRRAIGESSVGHLGTLDPMATGLLPLLLGRWTRLAQFYKAEEKDYTGTIHFGYATDTFDAAGVATAEPRACTVSAEGLRGMAASFLGESEQVPPVYSAKKIDGKPAYARARAGEQPMMKPVRVIVREFALETLRPCAQGGLEVDFRLGISSGGYVRSVANAMGEKAGCGAHLSALRRVRVGPLRLDEALGLDELIALAKGGVLEQRLPHARTVLSELPGVSADVATLQRLRNGAAVALPEFSNAPLVKVFAGQSELVAVARRLAGVLFQPHVVLEARSTGAASA